MGLRRFRRPLPHAAATRRRGPGDSLLPRRMACPQPAGRHPPPVLFGRSHLGTGPHPRHRRRVDRGVTKVLVTGMSGTGKSSALRALAALGHRTVDTDSSRWSRWEGTDWIWREDAMSALLASRGPLFVAGCKTNQGRFYPR